MSFQAIGTNIANINPTAINPVPQQGQIPMPQMPQQTPTLQPIDLNASPAAIYNKPLVTDFNTNAQAELSEFLYSQDMEILRPLNYMVTPATIQSNGDNSSVAKNILDNNQNLKAIRYSYKDKDGKDVKETLIYDEANQETHSYYTKSEINGSAKADVEMGSGKTSSQQEFYNKVSQELNSAISEGANFSKIETWQ